jgi:hypothetical protein
MENPDPFIPNKVPPGLKQYSEDNLKIFDLVPRMCKEKASLL